MQFVSLAALKHVPENSLQWLALLAELLPLNAEQLHIIQDIVPAQKSGHIPSSNCFRTYFEALARLRTQNNLQIEVNNNYSINDVSVRFSRYEETVFFIF